MKKKVRGRSGMTITELLVSVLLISLMSLVVVAGTNTAVKAYRQSVGLSRAQTALSTLMEAVGDELRLADKVSVADNVVTYASARKNAQEVRLGLSTKGELLVDNTLLVGDGIYSEGALTVSSFRLSYADQVFRVSMTVSGADGVSASAQCSFRCLNGDPLPESG